MGPRGSRSIERALEATQRRDDDFFSSALQEFDRGAYLRTHAPLRKLTFRKVAADLRKSDAPQVPLIRSSEMHRHLLNAGGDREDRNVETRRKVRRGQVLVDDRLDASVYPRLGFDDGNTTTSGGYHHEPRFEQGANGLDLNDTEGSRRGDNTAITTAGVLHHVPAILGSVAVGFLCRAGRANRLARVLKRWIGGVYHGLRQQTCHAVVQTTTRQLV